MYMEVGSVGKHLRIIGVCRLFCIILNSTTRYLYGNILIVVIYDIYVGYWLSVIAVAIDHYRLNRMFIIIPSCFLYALFLWYYYI